MATRVDEQHRAMFEAAARAEGVTVSRFIADAATEAARRALSGMLDSFDDDASIGTPADIAELLAGFVAADAQMSS